MQKVGTNLTVALPRGWSIGITQAVPFWIQATIAEAAGKQKWKKPAYRDEKEWTTNGTSIVTQISAE